MQDVSKGEGRTVLFVSHNMSSIRALCHTGIVLSNGKLDYFGTSNDAITHYLSHRETVLSLKLPGGNPTKDVEFLSAQFADNKNLFSSNESIDFIFEVQAHRDVPELRINATIYNSEEIAIGSVSNIHHIPINRNDHRSICFSLHNHNLSYGQYSIAFSLGIGNYLTAQRDFDIIPNTLTFSIETADKNNLNSSAINQWNPMWGSIMFDATLQYI